MASRDLSVGVNLIGRDVSASKALNQLGIKAKSTGDVLASMSKKASYAIAAIGAAAIEATQNAAKDAAAQRVLALTLQNTSKATKEQIKAVEDYITKTSLAVGVTDDELRPAFARLNLSTNSLRESQKLLNLALDIRAAKPTMNLAQIVNALGKAYDGNGASLGRLGLGLDSALIKGKNFNKIYEALRKTFKGFAEQEANTTEGKTRRLAIAFDEARESLGYALIPYMEKLVNLLMKLTPYLERNQDKILKWGKVLLGVAIAIKGINIAWKTFEALQGLAALSRVAFGWVGIGNAATTAGTKVAAAGVAGASGWAWLAAAVAGTVALASFVNWMSDKRKAKLNNPSKIPSWSSESNKFYGGTSMSEYKGPKMAKGGIVSGPTMALIGEAGPEAVIPLSKMGGFGGGVNIYVAGSVIHEKDLAITVRDNIAQLMRRRGINPSPILGVQSMAYYDGTNAPTITLQLLINYSWVTVPTTDIKSISVRRGRTREDQNYQPGTLTVALDNISGQYNPDNQSSTYFYGGRTYLDTAIKVQLLATWNSTNYTLYTGYIEDVQVDVSLEPVTTIIATDALAIFSKLYVSALTTNQSTKTRIETILTDIGYPSTQIGTGSRILVPQDVANDALSLLEEAAACEFGRFWVNREGIPYFRSWDDLATMPFTLSLTDFHDLYTVEYDLVNTEPGSRYRINKVNVTGNNGSSAYGFDIDTTSIADYGLYQKSYSLPLNSSTDCGNLATQIVGRFAFPATRVNHIEFEAVGMVNLWDSILTTDLNYLVNVDRTTVDGYEMQVGGFVEGLNFDITPESWRYSLELSDFIYTPLYWIEDKQNWQTYGYALTANENSIWVAETSNTTSATSTAKVSKYTSNGNVIWQTVLTDVSVNPTIHLNAIAADSNSNSYVAGSVQYKPSNQTTELGYVAKLDTFGNVLWEKKIGTTTSVLGYYVSDIKLDASNNIHIAFADNSSASFKIIKMDNSGNVIWATSVGSSSSASSLALNSSGNVYFSGYSVPASGGRGLVKLNSSGTFQWFTSLNAPIGKVKVDNSGNIWVNVSHNSGAYYVPGFAKFDSSGTFLTSYSIPEVLSDNFYVGSFDFDSNNNLFYTVGASTSYGYFYIIQLDSSFNQVWKRKYSSAPIGNNLTLHNDSFSFSTYNTFVRLPQDGTKTGSYTLGTLSINYSSVTTGTISTVTYTPTTASRSSSSISNLSIANYSTKKSKSTFTPNITRIQPKGTPMPYHIGKIGSYDCQGYPVVKDSDGTVMGCHKTEKDAKAQLAALYANELKARQEILTVKP